MGKLRNDQKGFSAVEVILVLVIVALIGAVGFLVYKNHNKTTTASVAAKTATSKQTTTKPSTTTPASTSSYLVIKEWGVKVTLTAPISNATYQIVTNNKYLPPSAFLSTATLDASTDCTSYYTKDASPDDPTPTFQRIERFALTDTTSLSEGSPTITAAQAAQQQPSAYKQIGNYVYYYGHGNGMPCQEETTAQENAFEATFATIQAQ